ANHMAAFTAKDPADREAYMARWTKSLGDETIIGQTILFDRLVAGSVLSFEESSRREVSFWMGKHYWGKGIATSALVAFLDRLTTHPSMRVLPKIMLLLSEYWKNASSRSSVRTVDMPTHAARRLRSFG